MSDTVGTSPKIKNDPIMNMIVKKFNVNLIPVNHVDVDDDENT